MNNLLKQIRQIPKGYFSLADIRKISKLDDGSLKKALTRLVQNNDLLRITRGLYAIDYISINWERLAEEIYPPSYLSFEWALAIHNILSQKPLHLILATTSRSKTVTTEYQTLFYHHLQPKMFWGYDQQDGALLATPEKAFVDLAYLSLNGYARFDTEEMNLELLDKKILGEYLKKTKNKKLTKLIKEKMEFERHNK